MLDVSFTTFHENPRPCKIPLLYSDNYAHSTIFRSMRPGEFKFILPITMYC